MFRIFKSLTKPQFLPLQTLSKTSRSTLAPLYKHSNKTLSYYPCASFSASAFAKRPESQYIQDLRLIQNQSDQELSSHQQILKKYIASQNFADFTVKESSHLLQVLDQLGKACFETPNKEGDALKYYEEALAFVNTANLKDSSLVGFIHNGLAYALYLHQRFDEALKNFEKGQEILEKVGLDSESVYPYIQNIYFQGVINFSKGNIEKAEEYLQLALEASEAFPERDQVESFLIDIYENLAYVYFKKNNLEQGHKFAEQALDSIGKIYGENDVRSVTLLRDLAYSLYGHEKFDDALIYATKLNDALKDSPEADKNELIQSLVLLGKIFIKKNYPKNAVEYGQKALKLCTESGKDFDQLEGIHSLLGASLLAEGKEDEGLKHLEEAAMLCGEYGDKSGNLNSHYALLADAYFRRKDMEKAEEIAKEALELYLLKSGQGSPDTQACFSLLLQILDAQKKTDDIAKLRQAFGVK